MSAIHHFQHVAQLVVEEVAVGHEAHVAPCGIGHEGVGAAEPIDALRHGADAFKHRGRHGVFHRQLYLRLSEAQAERLARPVFEIVFLHVLALEVVHKKGVELRRYFACHHKYGALHVECVCVVAVFLHRSRVASLGIAGHLYARGDGIGPILQVLLVVGLGWAVGLGPSGRCSKNKSYNKWDCSFHTSNIVSVVLNIQFSCCARSSSVI